LESLFREPLIADVPPLLLRNEGGIAPMVELLSEVAIWLVWLAARGVVLVVVSLPYGATAGIFAREVSPAAVIWQATARVGSLALIGMLVSVAIWPQYAIAAMWAAAAIVSAVVLVSGNMAEYLNHRRAAMEPIAGSDGG
jgi:hypothetical protein